ncbi:hypothetical protein [Nocardia sp. NPDC051463]|uniref:hypothetical protein n=1 Tax=Nocardia sp. NPDC051463 TaxID=3154845 RepID=UPI003450C39E
MSTRAAVASGVVMMLAVVTVAFGAHGQAGAERLVPQAVPSLKGWVPGGPRLRSVHTHGCCTRRMRCATAPPTLPKDPVPSSAMTLWRRRVRWTVRATSWCDALAGDQHATLL